MSLGNAALGGLSRNTVAPPATFYCDNSLIGAVTTTSFKVSIRTSRTEYAALSLEVSTDPTFSRIVATVAGASAAANSYWAQFAVTGLTADTTYYCRVMDGVTMGSLAPIVHTFKSGAMSFTMAFASCCQQGYNATAFRRILARQPTLLFHEGDYHYADETADDETLNFGWLNDAAAHGYQKDLCTRVQLIYQPSDHDTGTNESYEHPVKPAFQSCYRKMFPSYAIPAVTGWYQSIIIGRVRLIVLDTRSFVTTPDQPDSATKYEIGVTQMAWLESELVAAKAAHQAIIIGANVGWCGAYAGGHDGWYDYPTERARVVALITSNAISNVCILHGDMHGICVDDGSWTTANIAATPTPLAVYGAAPFNSTSSVRGNGWSHGYWPTAAEGVNVPFTQQYGMITVVDDGGPTITMTFDGYRVGETSDTLLISHSRTLTL